MSAPTLGALLDRRDLHLRAVTRIPSARRDAELRWVHSSDLPDPSPFLDDGVALLTTGSQFGRTSAHDYVGRLVDRGVRALGFGTGVVIPAVPDDLVAACERTGLPLFEVPYRTPFLAIARACADANAAHAFARRSWALAAQRSVSLAALRSDPLPAAIGELAHQLGGWVGLFDAAGGLSVARPADLPATAAAPLADAVARMLDAGGRAADTVTIGGSAFSVQTLGRGGALRGALAIGARAARARAPRGRAARAPPARLARQRRVERSHGGRARDPSPHRARPHPARRRAAGARSHVVQRAGAGVGGAARVRRRQRIRAPLVRRRVRRICSRSIR